MVSAGEFVYHGHYLVCSEGKMLRRGSFHNPELAEGQTYQYVARQKNCQSCPVKETCLLPNEKRRHFTMTMYYPECLRVPVLRSDGHTAASDDFLNTLYLRISTP